MKDHIFREKQLYSQIKGIKVKLYAYIFLLILIIKSNYERSLTEAGLLTTFVGS